MIVYFLNQTLIYTFKNKDLKMIDKVKKFKQFVNENYSTEFRFSLGENSNSEENLKNEKSIIELLKKKNTVSLKYKDGASSMGRAICMATISPTDKTDVVEYECIPQIETNKDLKTIRDTDTIEGAIQIIQRYAVDIYNDKVND